MQRYVGTTLGNRRKSLDNHHVKDISAYSWKRIMEASQKGCCSVFWKVKVKEERGIFELATFGYCNLTIKIALVLIVCAYCLDYLKELMGSWGICLHYVAQVANDSYKTKQLSLLPLLNIGDMKF